MIRDRKLQINVITLIFLCLGLCISSFAISYTVIKIENNLFRTGEIKINLNDGKAVINEKDPIFAPGTIIEKDFFIKNDGAAPLYYKLNFTSVSGGLKDIIEVTILDDNYIELISGKISEFEDNKVLMGSLSGYEKQDLIARFHFPEDAGNEYNVKSSLQFKMSAIAVQTKNNDPENPKFE